MILNGVQVFVGKFEKREKKLRSLEETFTNCFVKHLNPDVTDEQFKSFFSKYGEVSSFHVRRNEKGQAVGFGFAAFKAPPSPPSLLM
eukprot:gene41585-21161_t